MSGIKIEYGIDLGTTNSAICRMVKGKPAIVKTDTQKEIMPSCVSVNRHGAIRVGDSAYNTMSQDKRRATKTWQTSDSNTFLEFKRTMGTNAMYPCKNRGKDFTSVELSAEVLKTLKSFVKDTETPVTAAVVTVPAKFTVNQKTATLEAAKLAGIEQCELLQEPVAASLAYGITADEKNGIWMVFDFGGGTFDAALVRVEAGIMQVFDTDGDNYLGGKNLDYAIVDKIILPHLQEKFALTYCLRDETKKQVLRDAMKTYAEEVKKQLSFNERESVLSNVGDLGEDDDGDEIELDMEISREQLNDVMRPFFQKAADICNALLKRNGLTNDQLNKLILIGGPTYCPLLRDMLREQVTPNVDTSINPMTAVAVGAAIYASTRDAESDVQTTQNVPADATALDVDYRPTTVETRVFVTVRLPDGAPEEDLFVELERSDGAWSSGTIEIGRDGCVVEVSLKEFEPNCFSVCLYDAQGNRRPCVPKEITILQGTGIGPAVLPYNIGIAIRDTEQNCDVFKMAAGLEKNRSIPAVGVVNNRWTTGQLRTGNANDELVIPVIQVDDFAEAEGRTAAYYEHVADVIVTGADVSRDVPANSQADVTLRVDTSEQMTMSVYFPEQDITVEKTLDTSKKQSLEEAKALTAQFIREAREKIDVLAREGVDASELQAELRIVQNSARNDAEAKAVLQNIKMVLRKIEDRERETVWQRAEYTLQKNLERVESACTDATRLAKLRAQVEHAVRSRDVKAARELSKGLWSTYFSLTRRERYVCVIEFYGRNFRNVSWRDAARARQHIDRGLEAVRNAASVETLEGVVYALWNLDDSDADSEAKANIRNLLQ